MNRAVFKCHSLYAYIYCSAHSDKFNEDSQILLSKTGSIAQPSVAKLSIYYVNGNQMVSEYKAYRLLYKNHTDEKIFCFTLCPNKTKDFLRGKSFLDKDEYEKEYQVNSSSSKNRLWKYLTGK